MASDDAGAPETGPRDLPIRILHAVGTMDRGGAESMVMDLVRRLDRARFRCSVLAHGTDRGSYESELACLEVPVHRLPSLGSLGYPRYVRTLARFLRAGGPFDVVHSHLDWQGGAIAAAARFAGVETIIVHSHAASWSRPDNRLERLHFGICRLLVNGFATDAWACSRKAGEFLFGRGRLASRRFRVIPNAIDLDRFKPADPAAVEARRARFGIPSGALVLGHVGSLSPVKNQAFLLEVAARIAARGDSVRILLVGGGADRPRLEEQAWRLGIGKSIEFTGVRADVPEILSVIDVFGFPSLSEGLGMAAVEAQAVGIPTVASDAVPPEADMGLGLFTRVSLDPDAWVREIDHVRPNRRHDGRSIADSIGVRGYDARANARQVGDLYEAAVARASLA